MQFTTNFKYNSHTSGPIHVSVTITKWKKGKILVALIILTFSSLHPHKILKEKCKKIIIFIIHKIKKLHIIFGLDSQSIILYFMLQLITGDLLRLEKWIGIHESVQYQFFYLFKFHRFLFFMILVYWSLFIFRCFSFLFFWFWLI